MNIYYAELQNLYFQSLKYLSFIYLLASLFSKYVILHELHINHILKDKIYWHDGKIEKFYVLLHQYSSQEKEKRLSSL